MKTRLTVIALTAAMAATGGALAGEGIEGGKAPSATPDAGASGSTTGGSLGTDARVRAEAFTDLDRDGDGKLTREEAQAHSTLSSEWDSIDRDQSGDLDVSEFSMFESEGGIEGDLERDSIEPGPVDRY